MLWCLGFALKYLNNNKKYKTNLKQSQKKRHRTNGKGWKEKLFKTDAVYKRTYTSSLFLWVDFKLLLKVRVKVSPWVGNPLAL